MDRVRWVEYDSRRILYEDFSGLRKSEDIHEVTDTSTALIMQGAARVSPSAD